ncbi:hypothetical protein PMAYCL1PPCAC_14810 [Pristionchus mayeri]|uniref:Uncharacterized protein n=1 Tax=Pristionchus mayeri TaxID=1317129 RepID=A0AAN5CHQ1_9BILA|nr:hypothetical protein PMAYCL1PPCAC_14810 [Pristionchus mayeri]
MEAYAQKRNAKLIDLRMLNQSSIDVLDRIKRQSDAVSVSYKIEWNSSDGRDGVLEQMRECLGTRVGKLELYVNGWQIKLATFFDVFEKIRFRKLAVVVDNLSDSEQEEQRRCASSGSGQNGNGQNGKRTPFAGDSR